MSGSEFDAVGAVHLFKHFGRECFVGGAVGADMVVDAEHAVEAFG